MRRLPALARLTLLLLLGTACLFSRLPGSTTPVPAHNPSPAPAQDLTLVQPSPAVMQSSPAGPTSVHAVPSASGYDIGQPVLTDLYISPGGSDNNDGLSLSTPLKTITAAWGKIPSGNPLTVTGYRLNLAQGVYPCEPAEPGNCLNYFANRRGTFEFPIILRASKGSGTVTIRGGLNLEGMAYLYLVNLRLAGGTPLPTNASGNNLLHLADSDHILLRGMTLDGPDCPNDSCNNLQEVFKVNQVQYLYVENSVMGGAWHSVVDYFAVQYGHFLNNRLHTAGQWCMYVKGGAAYLRIAGNELDHCQLGFQAGQSSNLAVMRPPWLHYEAYDIKLVNNVLHDLPGVGLSVSGGYNILFDHNTLYRVGTSVDPGYVLVQAVPGERGCSATDELPNPVPTCVKLTGQGGWGPTILTDNLPAIPNRNIYITNNLIYNPAPSQTQYTHLSVLGPIDLPAGFQNLPQSVATDQNLVIAGNLIWNGPSAHPIGLDDTTGCLPSNPACNESQIAANNIINTVEPQLANPSAGDYHPVWGGNGFHVIPYMVPDFTWDHFSPPVPAGTLSNTLETDRDGVRRSPSSPPGAYAGMAQ